MPPKCNTYFQQGIRPAMNEGYNSQRMAACNIYRIQKSIPAPGLGKGGKRGTMRRNRRGSRRASRRANRRTTMRR